MKFLRWIAVVLVVLAAAIAPAAPVFRSVWESTYVGCFGGTVTQRLTVLPWVAAGHLEALRDIRADRLQFLTAGYPPSDRPILAELLRTRYGVGLTTVGGCMVDWKENARWAGYNGAMVHEVERRFGPNVLKTVQADAQREYEARMAKR